jgi:hypothetical protein
MRHTSIWIVWLANKMCDFGRHRIHVRFNKRCIMHRETRCGSPSQVMN